MIKRLKLTFIGINMGLVLVVLLLMFALVYGITGRDLERESMRVLETVAKDPSQMFRPGEADSEVQIPYFVIQMDAAGEPVAAGGYFDLSDQDKLLEILEEALEDGQETGVLEAYGLRYLASESRLGPCVVFADMSSERATLQNLVRACLGIGLVSLAAFFLISVYLARWAVRPVERAWEQQRRFVADASHELKTPLTVITTNAELLAAAPEDGAASARYAGNILTMARQMRGLVGGLLELARVENGAAGKGMERLNFTALVEDAALPFEPVFFERGLTLESYTEPDLFVRGSADHLRQAPEVLLDNALKYSTSPGKVSLTLRRRGRHALLSVASPGEGLSREELTDIFKRFYRADKARKMNESYGMGLSIAAGIVEAHGGRIWAQSQGGYNTFFVELPLVK